MNGMLWKEEEEEEKEDQTQMLTLEIVVSPAHTQLLSQSKKMNERKENLAYALLSTWTSRRKNKR